MRRRTLTAFLSPAQRFAAAACLLTAGSLFVVLEGAADEPYFTLQPRDAFVQLSLSSALLTLWATLVVAILLRALSKRMNAAVAALLIALASLSSFYLIVGQVGYVADLEGARANKFGLPATALPVEATTHGTTSREGT